MTATNFALDLNDLNQVFEGAPADHILRLVPLVDACVVHEAEHEFFKRHPGTEELISDWIENVSHLVFGDEMPTNIIY